MLRLTVALLLLALLASPMSLAADQAAVYRTRQVMAIRDYREALERVRQFDEMSLLRATREAERARELQARGIIARRELEERERTLAAAERKHEETRRQILEADHAIMEILTAAPPAGRPVPGVPDATSIFVRYRGAGRWSLAEAPKIQEFFARRFGRPLPVSAYGQTPLHDRMGFDHHEALDVALLPDSVEGAALLEYLRQAGISYLAYRGGVPGQATGAHIHIGEASRRL